MPGDSQIEIASRPKNKTIGNHKKSESLAPQLRSMWTSNQSITLKANDSGVHSFTSLSSRKLSFTQVTQGSYELLTSCIMRSPGLMIEIILNLFLSISFGQVFFPATWEFPADIPRSIGIQMFLFSTMICQIVMTSMSNFPYAAGLMMVENVPFMHSLANIGSKYQDDFRDTFATVLLSFALSSVVVGLFFFILGYFKLGNAVYFFPKHVIIGCIGGIGVFLITTSLEVSTSIGWQLTYAGVKKYFHKSTMPLWLTSVAYEVVLMISLKITKNNIIAHFYFVSIPFSFYLVILLFSINIDHGALNAWFFPAPVAASNPFLMWELLDFTRVSWLAIAEMVPTMISLAIFRYTLLPTPLTCLIPLYSLCYSLMHVPINIPSLSISTGKEVDMNTELLAHGISNVLAGCLGGLQNYLCYSNS